MFVNRKRQINKLLVLIFDVSAQKYKNPRTFSKLPKSDYKLSEKISFIENTPNYFDIQPKVKRLHWHNLLALIL